MRSSGGQFAGHELLQTTEHGRRGLAAGAKNVLRGANVVDGVRSSVFCVPRVDDENVAAFCQATQTIGTGFVVTEVDRHAGKSLFDQLRGPSRDAFGQ